MTEETRKEMENAGDINQASSKTPQKGTKKIYWIIAAAAVVLASVLGIVLYVQYTNSPEYKLVEQGIWYMDGEPQIVFFEDGTGKEHGTTFYWKMLENDRLYLAADGGSGTYDIFFEDGEGKTQVLGTDVYLHLIDEDGYEQIFEGGGIITLQDADYDWSQWEHD